MNANVQTINFVQREWSLAFGRYEDKTLPQVLFCDPDWFFYWYWKGSFQRRLAEEAEELYRKARAIRIPPARGVGLVAFYLTDDRGKFVRLVLLPEKHAAYERGFTKTVIDLNVPTQQAPYDKKGTKQIVADLKEIYFGGKSQRMTKERCEAFYDDEKNFDLDGSA